MVTGTRNSTSNIVEFNYNWYTSGNQFAPAYSSAYVANLQDTWISALSAETLAAVYDIDVMQGADIDNLTSDILETFDEIQDAWDAHAPNIDPTITSGTDGVHGTNSLHYSGEAVDLRTNNLTPAQVQSISNYLSTSLGANYDVVVESTQIHLEYDPGP